MKRKRNGTRSPNGFGTCYRLPGKRSRPWVARVTVGWTTVKKNGREVPRQIYKTIGYFAEKKDGLAALGMHQIKPISSKTDITLGELYEEWASVKYEEEISRQTIDNYKSGWKHISKYKNVPFKNLRSSHFQVVINSLRSKGMSKSTLNKIKLVVSMLYDYAIENGVVEQNYGKRLKIKQEGPAEKEIFNDVELKKIEKAAKTDEWASTILILIYTGLRVSEMLLLTRFSVDFESNTITGGIKTDAGRNRTIPIHPKILKYIKFWHDKNGDTLICHKEGQAIRSRYYREKYYRPTLERLGVRILDPHNCRHTFASLLYKAGVGTLIVQRLLGHAHYSTTADTYTHTDVDDLKSAIEQL